MLPFQFVGLKKGVNLPNFYHTPFDIYFRVADPTDDVPLPPIRCGRYENLNFNENGEELEPTIGSQGGTRIINGQPLSIEGKLYHSVFDQNIRNSDPPLYYSRNFNKSKKSFSVNSVSPDGANTNFIHSSKRCSITERASGGSRFSFKRYSDNAVFSYNPEPFFTYGRLLTESFEGFAFNSRPLNLAINASTSSRAGYGRMISTDEWVFAAGINGNRNTIHGFQGRSIDDEISPIDEIPSPISVVNPPIGECWGIQGIGMIAPNHCVMQAAFVESLGWPNPSGGNPGNNPWPQVGSGVPRQLFSCRIYRIDIIDGVATYTLTASVINEWQPIPGLIDRFRAVEVSASGNFLSAIMGTKEDGIISHTFPFDVSLATLNLLNTRALFEVNPSFWLRNTNRTGNAITWQYSRNKGASWIDFPNTAFFDRLRSSSGNNFPRGSYCVRHDINVSKPRFDFMLPLEVVL